MDASCASGADRDVGAERLRLSADLLHLPA